MKRKLLLLLSIVCILFEANAIANVGLFTGIDPNNFNPNPKQVDKNIDYHKMIAFLKQSNDPKKIFSLGMLYVNGIMQDGKMVVHPDPILAEKYIMEAYKKGFKEAKTILGGLYIYNPNMQKIDPSGGKAEKILSEEYKKGNTNAGLILSSLYIIRGQYDKAIPILLSEAEKGSAEAQFTLAILFKQGIRNQDGSFDLKPDEQKALFYLNLACMNPNKSEEIKKMCYDPRFVVIEKQPKSKK